MSVAALAVIAVAILVLVALAKRIGVAYPILLVLGGIAIGYIPGIPRAENTEEREEVLEAYEEHGVVKVMIGEIEDLDPKDETYKPKLTVLKELVMHHVKEEEGPLFKMAREIFEPEELDRIGERIVAAKEEAGAE